MSTLDTAEEFLEALTATHRPGSTWRDRATFWEELAAYCAANAEGIREDHGEPSVDPELDWDDDWEPE